MISAPTTWIDSKRYTKKNSNDFSIRCSEPMIDQPPRKCSRPYRPFATVIDHTREAAYLDAIASGRYRPELLFPKQSEIVERIRQHPALLWKMSNVAEHLSKSKKHP
jgi:hypothetical protein